VASSRHCSSMKSRGCPDPRFFPVYFSSPAPPLLRANFPRSASETSIEASRPSAVAFTVAHEVRPSFSTSFWFLLRPDRELPPLNPSRKRFLRIKTLSRRTPHPPRFFPRIFLQSPFPSLLSMTIEDRGITRRRSRSCSVS